MMGKWTIRIPNTKHDKTRWLDRSGKKHTIELQQSEKSVMYLYPWFLCNNAAALRGAACCQLMGGGSWSLIRPIPSRRNCLHLCNSSLISSFQIHFPTIDRPLSSTIYRKHPQTIYIPRFWGTQQHQPIVVVALPQQHWCSEGARQPTGRKCDLHEITNIQKKYPPWK